jgi:hypothetical protein
VGPSYTFSCNPRWDPVTPLILSFLFVPICYCSWSGLNLHLQLKLQLAWVATRVIVQVWLVAQLHIELQLDFFATEACKLSCTFSCNLGCNSSHNKRLLSCNKTCNWRLQVHLHLSASTWVASRVVRKECWVASRVAPWVATQFATKAFLSELDVFNGLFRVFSLSCKFYCNSRCVWFSENFNCNLIRNWRGSLPVAASFLSPSIKWFCPNLHLQLNLQLKLSVCPSMAGSPVAPWVATWLFSCNLGCNLSHNKRVLSCNKTCNWRFASSLAPWVATQLATIFFCQNSLFSMDCLELSAWVASSVATRGVFGFLI